MRTLILSKARMLSKSENKKLQSILETEKTAKEGGTATKGRRKTHSKERGRPTTRGRPNEEGMIEKLKYLAPIGKNHHSLLNFNFCCYTKSTKSRVDKYRYDKGNYKEMREMMTSRNWNEDFRDNPTEQCWAILEESIRNASNKHIPKCTMGSKARNARPLYTNTKTITAVKRKSEAYMLYRDTRNEQHYIEYRRASNRVKTEKRHKDREGNITPIFKKGQKHLPGNYRPVSLTSVACKMMEKLVRNEVMAHMTRNNLLSNLHHGFMYGCSCTTQLLEVLDK